MVKKKEWRDKQNSKFLKWERWLIIRNKINKRDRALVVEDALYIYTEACAYSSQSCKIFELFPGKMETAERIDEAYWPFPYISLAFMIIWLFSSACWIINNYRNRHFQVCLSIPQKSGSIFFCFISNLRASWVMIWLWIHNDGLGWEF